MKLYGYKRNYFNCDSCYGFYLDQPIIKDHHNCFWKNDCSFGFALLFPLDLIVLGLDVEVLGCIPRDPSVAWQSWKTWGCTIQGTLTQQGCKKQ